VRSLLLASIAVLLLALGLAPTAGAADPFAGDGMWIWQVQRAAGGDPDGIAAQAQAAGIDTLFVKAAHGPALWTQFSPQLVAGLHAHGLSVCAYQRLQGRRPIAEARTAARAVAAGADCFVIDAETELEARYPQARAYVKELRRRIGPGFPVGFTSFPYVDLHRLLPYSVFLGPGAATVNLPQIYWKAIGDRPATAIARTVAANRLYGRPLAPIGQLYSSPKRNDVFSFRQLALASGATGVSWWSWDSAAATGWAAITRALTPPALPRAAPPFPTIRPGTRSDYVVWAKDHLRERGLVVTGDTRFDTTTRRAVQSFQQQAGLPVTGALDADTWSALLAH
jgi:peptidoglycan hydrolase-like protein with peptidoglycan-binding domain